MALNDPCCTLVPYFNVHEGKLDEYKALCEQFIERTQNEEGVMFYGFSFDGNVAHCREGYQNADGILAHLGNVGDLLEQALQISDIARVEVHAPAEEIEKLREPLADLNATFYTMELGFRR